MEKVIPIIDIPYHSISPRVLVCGDPKRAEMISERLELVEVVAKAREYWTFNGSYKNVPVTVASHGVGGGGASIAFEGLIIGGAKVMIRVGTCGSLQKGMKQGDLIIATAACREDGVSQQIIPMSYPAVADIEVVMALKQAAVGTTATCHTGIITTSGIFYPGMIPTNNHLYAEAGVLAMENEASVLFVISTLHNVKAGCIIAADGPCFEFVGSEDFDHYPGAMSKAVEDEITIALEAVISVPLD